MQAKIEKNAERLAGFLSEIAVAGKAVPQNISRAAAKVLEISAADARIAQGHLVVAGRLVTRISGSNRTTAIDGIYFQGYQKAPEEVEKVKTVLRRHFPQVIDPRTVRFPARVFCGTPEELTIGSMTVSFMEACELAERLEPVP